MKADTYEDIVCHYCGGYNSLDCEECIGSGCVEEYNTVSRDLDWRAYNRIGTNEFTIHDLMSGDMIRLDYEDIEQVYILMENVLEVANENAREFERMEAEEDEEKY